LHRNRRHHHRKGRAVLPAFARFLQTDAALTRAIPAARVWQWHDRCIGSQYRDYPGQPVRMLLALSMPSPRTQRYDQLIKIRPRDASSIVVAFSKTRHEPITLKSLARLRRVIEGVRTRQPGGKGGLKGST